MKRNIFKLLVSVLLLSLLITSLVILTSCNDETGENGDGGTTQNDATVTKIYIKDAEKPQTTFVLNVDPNFSTGKLTVEKSDSTTETIALNAEGVTVSGFDKATLGEQTVTFTYQEKTTTLKVNVVRRMVFKSLNAKYFVGDVFDKSTGSVRVTLDDGKTVNVNMSDEKISVEGFDSTKTGTQNVTIRYTSGDDSYADTLSVKVYDMGNMKLKAPGKLLYKSHDTELKITDAYLTVTASDDSTMTKLVPLTTEGVEITGFHPEEATAANIETPLSQQITVTYLGQTFTFNISITYSDVSIMRDAAAQLIDVDWSAETIHLTQEQGQLALDAMPLYFDMSTADRALLSDAELTAIVKMAAAYGAERYGIVVKEFADAFEVILRMDGKGNYLLTSNPTGKSYEAVVEAYDRLSNPEDEFIVLGKLLTKIVGSFGKDIIYADVTIQQLILVMQEDWVEFTAQVLDHMIKLHKDLSTVPADWTVESLANHSSEVIAAVAHINAAYRNYIDYVSAIAQVSSWRPDGKDDYLDIIYAYYLEYKEDTDYVKDILMRGIPYPGELQDLYTLIISGSNMLQEFQGASGIWKDTFNFLMIYDQAMELSGKISSTEGLYKDIYSAGAIPLNNGTVINFPTAISQFLSPAYYTFCNSLYGDPEFTNMYGVYMTIVRAIIADGENHNVQDYYKEYQDFVDIFVSLSPAKQKSFLGTMYYLYQSQSVDGYMLFDYSTAPRGAFVEILCMYMKDRLSEEMMNGIAQDLWLAIEYYLNSDRYDDALSTFMSKMANVEKAYKEMSEKEQEKFNAVFEKVYQRYMALYAFEKDKATEGVEINLGDYAAVIEELRVTLGQMQMLLDLILDENAAAENQQYFFLLLAAHEKCTALVNQIMASNNSYVIGTYYNTVYNLTDTVKTALDDAYVSYRIYFVNVLRNVTFGVMDEQGNVTMYYAWNQYMSGKVSTFFRDAYDVMYTLFFGDGNISAEQFAALKSALAALEGNDFFLARSLIGADLYTELVAAFSEGDMKTMAQKMQTISAAHAAYLSAEEAEAAAKLAAYAAAIEDAAELAESLEENEEYKAYLKSLYDQFVLILESIQNSQVEEAA